MGLIVGVWPRGLIPRPAITAGGCLAGLAGLTALSMAWASDDGRAFTEVIRVLTYLGVFVAVVLASGSGRGRPWLLGLAWGLTLISVLALASRLEPGLFPMSDTAASIRQPQAQMSYPLGYWNAVAACATMAIALLAWLTAAGKTRWGRSIAAGLMPIPFLDLFLTSSRAGAAALLIGVVILVAIGPRRLTIVGGLSLGVLGAAVLVTRAATSPALQAVEVTPAGRREGDILLALTVVVLAVVAGLRFLSDSRLQGARLSVRPSRRTGVAAIAVAVVAVAVVLVAIRPLSLIANFTAPPQALRTGSELPASGLASSAGYGRFQYWEAAVNAFAGKPLTGIGAGGYEAWWGEHASLRLFVLDAHSLFLEMLGELGLIGLALIVGFLAIAALSAVRGRRDPAGRPERAAALAVLAIGTAIAAQDWMWEQAAVFGSVIVAAAVVTGPALGPLSARGPSRFGVGVGTLLVAWVALVAAAAGLATQMKLRDSDDAVDRGDLAGAVQDAREARALQPWASAPYLQIAQIEQLQGDLPAAEQALTEAIARAPDAWQVWFVAASLDSATGDLEGLVEATAQTNRLRPDVPFADEPGGS